MSITAHKSNLLGKLKSDIQRFCEDQGLSSGNAFSRVAAGWLGYDLEDDNFIDSKDRGIDFWFRSDAGFDIFQTKSHECGTDGGVDLAPMDEEGVRDLQAAQKFLLTSFDPRGANEKLRKLRHEWDHAIGTSRISKEPAPIDVNLGLVVLSEGLTQGAEVALKSFCESLAGPAYVENVPVHFRARLYSVDDLLDARWRMDNREWRDKGGAKKDWIKLHPENIEDMLSTANSAVFYCRAFDLSQAFQDFGYQIFEPNVRCNISQSKVNAAIRESVLHRQTREDFRFLNNGVTLTCKGFQKPNENRPYFRVVEPGVINGLQTVFALHEAYLKLPQQEDKNHFETKCYVLVRLLQEHSVQDVSELVRATNTQNPMEPRNLVSNKPEQVLFERLFADLGWFYERKQGAWDAFAADPRRWRTLHGVIKSNFQVSAKGGGRPRVRRVDNEVLAQAWLSFIGFCEEAVHSKRLIFEKSQWYDLVFLHTPVEHAIDYNYKLDEATDRATGNAPAPALMLTAFQAREFARRASPTARANRDGAIKRLKLDPQKMTPDEIALQLSQDPEFNLGQILNGMSFVFVEFLGYVLFKSFGKDLAAKGPALIRNGSFAAISSELDYDSVADKVNKQRFAEDDILAVTWWVFRHVLEEMIGSAWLASYRTARNKTRFNHSSETRTRIHKGALELHRYTEKKELTRTWATGIRPPDGLFGFVRRVVG